MFYYLRGELVYREPTTAVIDCGGVAYKLTVSLTTGEAISERMGAEVKLYTYLQVREDGIELFGFASGEELQTFKYLIGVSGVGPKAAMSVLSTLTPSRFSYAVCTEDIKAIAKAPGLGNKTASRIILELKDKYAKEFLGAPSAAESTGAKAAPAARNGKLSEATEALMALGYDRSEILDALRGIDTEALSVEQIITQALKKFI